MVASEGQDAQGRNRLRMVMIDARREGVQASTCSPATPFVPEVPHAELQLPRWRWPGEVLPGDGYTRYLKPFRTVEDCHVHAALLGWLLQVGRRSGWPERVQDEVLALAVTMRGLALADPASSAVHVALGGALDLFQRLVKGLEERWPRWTCPRASCGRGTKPCSAWRARPGRSAARRPASGRRAAPISEKVEAAALSAGACVSAPRNRGAVVSDNSGAE